MKTIAPTHSLRSRRQQAAHLPGRTLLRLLLPLLMLAALGIGLVKTARRPAPQTTASQCELARDNARTLLIALRRLSLDCGRPPTQQEGLVSLIHNPGMTNWHGPYIFELKPDPWGKSFRYTGSALRLEISSDGPDGLPDTADDVSCGEPVAGVAATNKSSYNVRILP